MRLLEGKRPKHKFALTGGARSIDIKVGAGNRPPRRPGSYIRSATLKTSQPRGSEADAPEKHNGAHGIPPANKTSGRATTSAFQFCV